ncbi:MULTISPECIES: metal ABC transporter solute-binding protein, Zn/Mn family [Methanocalculus]|uniref:metal ABC transporter solute-binding protein, Zn/Mn family n=1 Tax=Methanocalculus TaxID=71151 RepID=UPI0020A1C25A|nr:MULTISPECIES: zinc ABC transporter substrate-binding protein [unclassified Methanocalculus]MCP1662926.1 zinc transport system substrate-binding protein [Methanocalculus sp. AMF5]
MKSMLPLLLMLLVVSSVPGCLQAHTSQDEAAIPVAVSIPPLKEIAEAVGGERISVAVVVPPGSEPHTYEPTPARISRISGSALFFRIGPGLLPFEDQLAGRLEQLNPEMAVIDLSSGIDLIDAGGCCHHHAGGGYDPHTWLSPRNGAVMADTIAHALIEADPGNEELYLKNLEAYIRQVDEVDSYLNASFAETRINGFIVTHDAWGYFARDYGLEQIAIHVGGREPTAREIQSVIRRAERDGIGVIFVEPQFSPKAAEVIAREIDGTVVEIDPLAEAYLENFQTVADALTGALG